MNHRHPTLTRAVSALSIAVLTAGFLAAQDAPTGQQPEGAFTERINVNLVTVDVVVTDREGNLVTGLTRDDFEVSEDGRPMKITNFQAVEGGSRVTPEAPPTATATAAGVTPPVIRPTSDDPPLHLIVYVDNINIRPAHRSRVFRDVRTFLGRHVQSNDRVMLASYERSLKIRQGLTSDSRLIANGLFDLEELSGNSTQADEERRNLIQRIEEARSPQHVRTWLRTYSQSVQNDLIHTMRALQELVDSLAGLPGRKALLYVSDGLPMTPGEEFYVAAQASYPQESFILDARSYDATPKFEALAALANSNRVSFYTLDAAGVRVSSAIDVERGGGGIEGFHTSLDSATVKNLHNSLKFLADETGGAAIVNTNNYGPALDRLAGDFETYYSLGYSASHYGDGKYYKLKVEVKRRGLEVRHREGYRDKPLHTRMADATLSTLKWGLQHNNELGVKLAFRGGQPTDEKGEAVVSMIVEIPLERVTLIPRGETYEGRVKLFIAVADKRSRVAPPQEVPVQIRIPADEIEHARTRSYHYQVPLLMRTGGQRVAVGVHDEISAIDSFVTTHVAIGEV